MLNWSVADTDGISELGYGRHDGRGKGDGPGVGPRRGSLGRGTGSQSLLHELQELLAGHRLLQAGYAPRGPRPRMPSRSVGGCAGFGGGPSLHEGQVSSAGRRSSWHLHAQ